MHLIRYLIILLYSFNAMRQEILVQSDGGNTVKHEKLLVGIVLSGLVLIGSVFSGNLAKAGSPDLSGNWSFEFVTGRASGVCLFLGARGVVIDNGSIFFKWLHPRGSVVSAQGLIQANSFLAEGHGGGYFLNLKGDFIDANTATGTLNIRNRLEPCNATWKIRRNGAPVMADYVEYPEDIVESDSSATTDEALSAKLSKIKSLLEENLITEEEAAAKRQQLLEEY